MITPPWTLRHRFDPEGAKIADRHYNRQSIGSPQFVPPGRCVVLTRPGALWVTSWPFAEYTKHAWAGAWVNSTFRRESGPEPASDLITAAVAATRAVYGAPPPEGFVSFVNPAKVPAVRRRGAVLYGYCYLMAGWEHVGFTKGGLWAWHLAPEQMPEPDAPREYQPSLLTL